MTPNTATTLSARVTTVLTRDPKKSLMLTALVTVLAVLWGRMMLGGGKVAPKSAAANSHITALPSLTPPLPKPPPNGRAALQAWLGQPMPQGLSRNLFDVKLEYFPTDENRGVSSSGTIDQPTFWDQLAKSMDAQAEEQHKREILIQNLRQQAGQLQLTSTVMGPHPKAVINGQMVGEGEVVAQFRIVKIDARSAVVERDGVRLEIAFK